MPENLSFMLAKCIGTLWQRLTQIRSKREAQLMEIADTFGDPLTLAEYYVEPKCQHHNPADYNEIEAISYVQSPVFLTINAFFNREFHADDGRNQMFILSDAGMGKTSLLMMLKLSHMTAFWPKKFNCELFKLGPETIDRIRAVQDRARTVLLLDALDEDPEGFGNVEKRLIEILSETRTFRRVVISCRTQYFPAGGDDPFDRPGRIEVGGFVCPMVFLSLFDDDQVEEYLAKRFPKSESQKTAKCKAVVQKMESLRFRPLLLAHIEDIVESESRTWNEYTIYHALVSAWLLREEAKASQRRTEVPATKRALWSACIEVAAFMQRNDSRFVSVDELKSLVETNPELSHLTYFDVGGRSLLNRNSNGDFRFSHYTTQEFLIAYAIASGRLRSSTPPIRATDQVLFFLGLAIPGQTTLATLDLRGCDLSKLDVKGADMSHVLLKAADLRGLDLSETRLEDANLEKAILEKANLSGASMTGAVLRGAELSEACLENARMDGADLREARLQNANLRHADLEGVSLQQATLSGAVFDEARLIRADFRNARLENCSMRNADLTDADLSQTDLATVDLHGADLRRATLAHCNLAHQNLTETNLEGANLTGVRLKGAGLRQLDSQGADLTGVHIDSSDLEGIPLNDLIRWRVSLKRIDLRQCDFRSADLSQADLVEADLSGVDLHQATFFRADLSGADLRRANLDEADLSGAYYSAETKFPRGFFPYDHGMIMR